MSMIRVLDRPVQVAAGQTDIVIKDWGNNAEVSCRVSVFVGQVTGTVDLAIQDSVDCDVWNDVKATTIGASTNKTLTFTASDANIVSAAHGYLPGDEVALISVGGILPTPFVAGTVYTVATAATNSFTLKAFPADQASPTLVPQTSGTGTQTSSKIRETTIPVQAVATADQTVTPLRSHLRLRATTGAGETIQICKVWASF